MGWRSGRVWGSGVWKASRLRGNRCFQRWSNGDKANGHSHLFFPWNLHAEGFGGCLNLVEETLPGSDLEDYMPLFCFMLPSTHADKYGMCCYRQEMFSSGMHASCVCVCVYVCIFMCVCVFRRWNMSECSLDTVRNTCGSWRACGFTAQVEPPRLCCSEVLNIPAQRDLLPVCGACLASCTDNECGNLDWPGGMERAGCLVGEVEFILAGS